MYSIIETKDPPLVKPLKMTCDAKLRPRIPHPLPNRGGARFLIVGAPGSDKTNWAVSQLIKGGAYHRVFDSLHVVMPFNSRASFAKDPFDGHNKNYSELTQGVLDKKIVDVKKNSDSGGQFVRVYR